MMDMIAESVEPESDGQWELPEGWAWTRLGLVAPVNPSTSFDELSASAEIPFIPMAAVSEETGAFDQSARRAVRDVSKGYVRFMEGDVIFAKITPCMENGKVAPVTGLPGRYAAGSTEFHVFRPAAVDQRFLWYWLVGRGFRGKAKRNMSGSAGQLRVPVDYLRGTDFPLAPLGEQRRIVARVDALFAEIAAGEAALAAARKGLDTFRRALLKAAVTGELTKDWREANPVTETGHELLARIAKSRAARTPAKGRGKRAAAARPLDPADLPALPEGWAWGTLREIADSVRNGTSAAPRAEANTNEILRISSVRPLWVDEKQIRYLDAGQAAAASDATVESGDLLFTRYNGSADLVGVGAIYKGVKRFYPDKIIRVRLHSVLSSHLGFVELAVNCGVGRKHIASNIKTTAGQQGLSGESLKDTPIPIPPPAEAAEILRRVSEELAAAADTLATLDAEAADAARLKESILKSAFEGRLVPQDPADERAADLLARLAANPTVTRARRGRTKANISRVGS
jgi:type I restriction enzyme S subunit